MTRGPGLYPKAINSRGGGSEMFQGGGAASHLRNACGSLCVVGTGLLSWDGRWSLAFFSWADWRAEGGHREGDAWGTPLWALGLWVLFLPLSGRGESLPSDIWKDLGFGGGEGL